VKEALVGMRRGNGGAGSQSIQTAPTHAARAGGKKIHGKGGHTAGVGGLTSVAP